MPIKVLVADGHRLVADALARVLRQSSEFMVCEELPTSGQELIGLAARLKPDVVLLDYWLPGMEAPAATRMIISSLPDCKILLLSWLYSAEQIAEGLHAGAVGFLGKNLLVNELETAIRQAASGASPVHEKQLDEAIRTIGERAYKDDKAWEGLAMLTPREIEILKLMDEGRLIEQIAKKLEIKPATVRNHIHNILEKTGTQSHVQALALARHHGLIRQ